MMGAASLAFAVWESVANRAACRMVDGEAGEAERLRAVWLYTLIAWSVCLPLSIWLGKSAAPHIQKGEAQLAAYRRAKAKLPEYEDARAELSDVALQDHREETTQLPRRTCSDLAV